MQMRGICRIGVWLSVVVFLTTGIARAQSGVCSGHGVDPKTKIEVGLPVNVTVKVDGQELDTTRNLGVRCPCSVCGCSHFTFEITASDPDQDV